MFAIGAIVILLVAVAAFVFLRRNDEKSMAPEDKMDDQRMEDTANIDSDGTPAVAGASDTGSLVNTANGVTTVTMEAGSFYFKPNQITVKKGDKVKVVITSHDMMHNFNIDELKVKSPLVKAGETSTVEFTADKVGNFQFYCSVGQHRAHGQVGTLTVTE
jgi:nitrosocyanin